MSSTARVAPERELTHDLLNPVISTSNQNTCAVSGHADINAELISEYTGPVESVLPREFRQRLHKHFARIEREFEREYRRLYGENLALGASLLSQRFKQQYKQSASRLVSSLRPSAGHAGTAGTIGQNSGLSSGHVGSSTMPSTVPANSLPGTPAVTLSHLQANTQAQTSSTVFAGTLAGHGGSWQLVSRVTGHRDGIWEVTPHRRFLATASADNTVRLWTNSSPLKCLKLANANRALCIRADTSSMMRLLGEVATSAHLLHYTSGCLMVYLGHYGSANSVRFRTRDHLLLTSSGDGTAHLIRLPFDLLMKATNCLSSVSQNSASSSNAVVAAFEAASSALTSEFAGSGAMGLGVGTGNFVCDCVLFVIPFAFSSHDLLLSFYLCGFWLV
ncbi:unnamed protein product [Echinostoma caproni]|uniref:WD repeat-containing protein 37 n=1 Tax=Echinostoma caproni TaxID=27848 RepID=A0A183AVP3_9TREM|nr:unnamed protein product [Echinostoma caproni]